jgi:hypothetical protein
MVSARHWGGVAAALCTFALMLQLAQVPSTEAADHGEAPLVAFDQAADIADVYLFLDPNDNTKVIMAFDTHGFIVPAENANLGLFDSTLTYRFQIENTGDARGDGNIDVTFSKQTDRAMPQTATIKLLSGATFTAPTTVSSATAATPPTPTVTTDATSGVSFFAGLTDDPFFFDIPAELKYRKSRTDGSPDPTAFNRMRDSFAGYNVEMIVLSVPATLLRGSAGDVIGVAGMTLRSKKTTRNNDGTSKNKGPLVTIDRMGIPAVATVFIPYSRKDEYNAASTTDDAAGKFADDIIASLHKLLTDDTSIGILAGVAVTNGDMLRLNLATPNTGSEGGKNSEASFPNGRRPNDDVIDIIVTLVNNRVPQGDNVNDNEEAFRDTFPFFAPVHQPFPAGTIDDDTRN